MSVATAPLTPLQIVLGRLFDVFALSEELLDERAQSAFWEINRCRTDRELLNRLEPADLLSGGES